MNEWNYQFPFLNNPGCWRSGGQVKCRGSATYVKYCAMWDMLTSRRSPLPPTFPKVATAAAVRALALLNGHGNDAGQVVQTPLQDMSSTTVS